MKSRFSLPPPSTLLLPLTSLLFSSSSSSTLPPPLVSFSSHPVSTWYILLIMSASCSALRRLTHRSPRTLQSRISSVSRLSPSFARTSLSSINSAAPRVSRFSTMAPLQSGAPVPPAADKAYDPEIKDMADYIHNYNVNSDLAVSYPLPKNQLNQR